MLSLCHAVPYLGAACVAEGAARPCCAVPAAAASAVWGLPLGCPARGKGRCWRSRCPGLPVPAGCWAAGRAGLRSAPALCGGTAGAHPGSPGKPERRRPGLRHGAGVTPWSPVRAAGPVEERAGLQHDPLGPRCGRGLHRLLPHRGGGHQQADRGVTPERGPAAPQHQGEGHLRLHCAVAVCRLHHRLCGPVLRGPAGEGDAGDHVAPAGGGAIAQGQLESHQDRHQHLHPDQVTQ